jgi:eukaryotic-like serine/threonine-protein kinase
MTDAARAGLPTDLPAPTESGESSSDLTGSVLAGRYRILRKLGEGAMGEVYLGEHLKIGRHDAIKVLRNNLSGDPEMIARFLRGTRNVSLIQHPNICTLYDFSDTESGIQFVAMEFVAGETLRELLAREGTLPIARAVRIVKQAADALQAAHEAGIVHRDLKPANIMVVPGRRGEDLVKVVDFDIAKGSAEGEGEEVTRHGFVVGTPEYMSPEQLIGERLDGRSDVYSLALVLFRMLTGTLPFRAEGMQDLMVLRLTQEPLRLSEARPDLPFPDALQEAVHRALARKSQDRQASAEEFGSQIAAALGGATATAPGALQAGAAPQAPASDHSLPSTRIATAGYAPEVAGASPTPPRAWISSRMSLLVASAALVAATVAVGAYVARDDETARDPSATLEQAAVPPDAIVDPSPGEVAKGETTIPPASGSGVDRNRSEPAGSLPDGGSARVAESPPSSAAPPAQPAWVGAVSPADVLNRLFDRFDHAPSRAMLEAIRDSASALAESASASTAEQANASYIVALALVELGDSRNARPWAERATLLAPSIRPYRTLHDGLK